MRRALELARSAELAGEVPVGAVLVLEGAVIGEGWNRPISSCDPSSHAEIEALRAGARQTGNYRLAGSTLYVTMEPCPMCAGAAVMSRVGRLVFGAWNDEYGAAGSRWDLVRDRRLPHRTEVITGVRTAECGAIVREFLMSRRPAREDR